MESYKSYWKEEDAFGRILCSPLLVTGVLMAVVIGISTDFFIKCNRKN